MLTIFATPKPFRGHFAVIQRNAIRSWTLLRPACEIILMGNEEGTSEIATEFGLRHIPDVARNTFGTPLVSDLFKQAQQISAHNILCYVNSDIILMSDLTRAVQSVIKRKNRFLLVGHRWNLDVIDILDFKLDWEDKLRNQVRKVGQLADHSAIDLFVFPRGMWGDIPPFAIGRPRWDNWMLYRARSLRAALIDATPVMTVIHQNHDYSHHPQGKVGVWDSGEALTNDELAGGELHRFTLADATHLLTVGGLRVTYDRVYWHRHLSSLPALYPSLSLPVRFLFRALYLTHPLRSLVGLTSAPVNPQNK
ncbi:MAG: hypothetical protein ACM3TN_20965 [Alphaproteobacteria bacterium]